MIQMKHLIGPIGHVLQKLNSALSFSFVARFEALDARFENLDALWCDNATVGHPC